ncbi:MAG: SDR family oxidoreductase [Thaumarchaeota archaeon]|nr:MAG: SDR family oxidoreductase [Nitrososphaerota archaeon]TLX90120.1 MAG: SDR family oxidoreductase [Nitrososphaerota archaeon]
MNDQEKQMQVAVVTGSSTGIGLETSLVLAKEGFSTYATMRNLDKSADITSKAAKEDLPLTVLQMNVDDDKSVNDTIEKIINDKGRIDVVVNNAGYALVGAFEETSMLDGRAQMETNFFGTVRVIKAVLPIMRNQRRGIMVNVTSMGGRVAIPFDSFYHASKFALEGLSESLQYEIEPFGVKVVLIEPGAVKSDFWKNLKLTRNIEDSPYRPVIQKLTESFEKMTQNAIPPEQVARIILKAVISDNPDFRNIVGEDAKSILEVKSNNSDKEFQTFMKKQFGF